MATALALMALLPVAAQAQLQRLSGAAQPQRASAAAPQKTTYSLTAPFEFDFATKAEFEMCTQDLVGDPSKKWFYVSSFKAPCTPSVGKTDLDNWLFLPAITFTDGSKVYNFAFDIFANMRNMPVSLEVWIGTSASKAGMTTKIGSLDNYSSTDGLTTSVTTPSFAFGVPGATAGTYYIGFRCTNTVEQDGWAYINNVKVTEAQAEASAPASVVDAIVTAAEQGALKANVGFNMPTTDLTGKALAADKELTAIITSPAESVTVKALPGAAVNASVNTLQGTNTITLQVNGDAEGTPVEYSVYTGHVKPMRVHDLTGVLSRDNLTYTLTWTAPTEGKDGGYIDAANLDYDIYLYNQESYEYDSLTTVGKNLTYTYQLTSADQLRSVRLAVFARNICGRSDDTINWIDEDPIYVQDMVGQPYQLPVIEEFDNGTVKYSPVRIIKDYDNYRGNWAIQDPSPIIADGNGWAVVGSNPLTEDETMGRLAIAKFSTLGCSAQAFSVKLLKYVGYSSKMTFYVRDYDHDMNNLVKLGEVDCSNATETSWADYTFPIPDAFMNKEWIQIVVDAQYDEVDYMYAIDRYSITGTHACDLSATGLSGDAAVEIGTAANYVAEVYNIGTEQTTATGQFDVVYDGQTVARSWAVEAADITSGDRANFTYAYTPTADDYRHSVTIRFTLDTDDEDATNNSAEQAVSVRLSATPVVTDLSGTATSKGNELEWYEPQMAKTIAQSFEQETVYSYDNPLAGLTNYDGDGRDVYKFQSLTMPNEQLPKAFMVVENATFDAASDIAAHSGSKFLMATCPDDLNDVPANDWLITPEVKGGSLFSFWLDIISENYPESVRVKYSTTTADPASFKDLEGGSILKYKRGWQKQEYTLPADAKYVAINYVSNDMFGIFIDDVRYVSATEAYAADHYNVYRDGTKIGQTDYTDATVANTYLDATAGIGQHDYHVTIVDQDGTEYGPSNTVTLNSQTDGIADLQAVATPTQAYTPSGTVATSQQKGLVIERMSNGTVRKVVRK